MSIVSVFKPARLRSLLASDIKNISRDPTLVFAAVLSVLQAIAIAIWRAPLDTAALSAFGVTGLIDYLVPVVLVLPAFLMGWIIGFLLLEDRDDGPLLALEVTPTGKSGFMLYRVTLTALLTTGITLLGLALLTPDIGWTTGVVTTILIALDAVCAAIVLPTVARNKVEGLAVTKVTNIAAMAPLIALIPSPWRYVGGIIPTFWIGEMFQLSPAQYLNPTLIMAIAVISHIAALWFLYRLFNKRIG